MSEAKRHHYNAAFNLALFTEGGERDGPLSVMLVPSGKRLHLKPDDIGFENNFYRVPDVEEVDPLFFEKALAEFESKAAPAIRQVVGSERMPPSAKPERGTVINYLSLQAARGPFARERMAQMRDLMYHLWLREDAASPERLRLRLTEQRATSNEPPPDDEEIDTFVRMVRERSFTIEHPQGDHVLSAIQMHDAILQTFAMRWWMVVVRRTPPLFITSDNPVTLNWGDLPPDARLPPPPHDSPGFGQPHTEVSVPLSRNVALIGTFERPPAPYCTATIKTVAVINARTIRAARRFLASTSDEIVWHDDEDGAIKQSDGIPSMLRALADRRAVAREAELSQLDRIVPLPE